MPPRSPASPDDIQMSTVFAALKRSAHWLILISAGLGGMTFAILAMMAPRYQSEAELAIVAKGASSTFADSRNMSSGPDLVTTRMDKEAINTHVRAMQSPELMEQIAADLKLKDRPEFNSALGPIDMLDKILRVVGIGGPRSGESERDRVLTAFSSRLEVYAVRESRFIGVRMTSIDPDLAANVANALAENYQTSLADQGVVEVDDQQSVLQGKIDKLTPEVAAEETEADQYRGKIDGFRGGAQNTGLNDQQMSELTGELTKAKAARGEAEARAKSAREMMKLGSADALSDVQKSPLIQNLVQQRVRVERQISELSATLMPGHPRMRQLYADLAGLKLQLNGEISKIVDSLDKEAKVAQGREDSIEQSLDDIKARVVTNAPEEAKLRQLEANAKAKRTELENLQAQLEANRKRLDARAQPVEAQIISKAQPTSVPVFPKRIQMSALIAVAALMFGTAWTLTMALFHGVRRSGVVIARPRPNPASLRAEPVLSAYTQPIVREVLRDAPPSMPPETAIVNVHEIASLARRLNDKRPAEGGYRTLLTGETASIDASDEALELVKAMAASGPHVILVDWSPSGEGLAGTAGLDASKGLNDLLSGGASFEEIIQRLPGSAAHAIASGRAHELVDGGVDPDHLNLVLDALDEAYDHIVVVGRHEEARKLFEAIEGRFDTGIVVADPRRRAQILEDSPGTFLGFEVADIDVIRIDRKPLTTRPVNQRITRVTQQRPAPMARPI
jgi:succinoglycan biosynthesis transport protein ExoP